MTGILNPATLAPEVDASILTGFPAAEPARSADAASSPAGTGTAPARPRPAPHSPGAGRDTATRTAQAVITVCDAPA